MIKSRLVLVPLLIALATVITILLLTRILLLNIVILGLLILILILKFTKLSREYVKVSLDSFEIKLSRKLIVSCEKVNDYVVITLLNNTRILTRNTELITALCSETT